MREPPPDDRRCAGIGRNGERCGSWARKGKDTCVKHGDDGNRCTANVTGIAHPENKGQRCRSFVVPGLDVCKYHGGNAKQARAAATRRVVESELAELVESLVGAPVGNPLTELAALAGRARAWMELLEKRVEKLLDSAGDAEDRDAGAKGNGIRYQAGAGEQIRAEIQLYERAMDRLGKFLADFARLNIDERLAAITEQQAERVVDAIEAALAHANVTGPVAVEAKQVAAGRLRAVA